MKNQAVALCRISSAGQSSGHSLEAQEQSVRNMAQEMGLSIVNIWSITQSSKAGTNKKRKDLSEIKDFCRTNRNVKYLLVDRVSRLMREWKLMLRYIFELEELGIRVIFCDISQRHLNGDDQMSQMMLIMEGFKTQQENTERAETTISRMKSRYAAGYYISHPHQGYKKSDSPGIHIKDEPRFSLLQKGSRLITRNQYTVPQAISWMNDNGYRTIGGRKLDLNHYVDFITDRYYCGKIDIQSEGWPKNIDGLHERMFSQKEHAQLVTAITKRNPRIRRTHNSEFPLANILRHTECLGIGRYEKFAGHFHNRGRRPNGKERIKKPVYDCRDCRKRVSRSNIHASFSEFLKSLEFIPSTEDFKTALTKIWEKQRGSVKQHVNALRRNKASLEHKVKETAIAYAEEPSGATKEALRGVLNDYDAQIKGIDSEIVEAANSDGESLDFVQFAIDFVEKMRTNWWSLSWENMSRGEQILFNGKIYADNSAKVHTPSLSTIYRLGANKKALATTANAHLVELQGIAPWSVGLSKSDLYRLSLFIYLGIFIKTDKRE